MRCQARALPLTAIPVMARAAFIDKTNRGTGQFDIYENLGERNE
jgi:hypothetical protein